MLDAPETPAAAPVPVPFWRAAVRPRSVLLLLLLLAAAAVCGLLGAWQLDRAQVRGAAQERERVGAILEADPEPLDDVLRPGETVTGEMVARKVEVVGTYEPGQLVVTGRAHDGVTGVLVLTPFRVAEGAGTGAVLPVVRGWLPADAVDDEPPPAPPAGTVTLSAYLQGSEAATGTTADGRTEAISSPELLNIWTGPLYSGYGVLVDSVPGQSGGLEQLDPPTRFGTGLNVRNLAYAVQWWVFGGFAVALWVRLVRDDARGRGPGTDPVLDDA
ncbi:SURF1 family protein [Cellulomonas marina]|uniref:SURF1-like protein n=1 Tax=Cellulomonas marina TaxID=988821 RepID=A0A1I1A017_9CELL|nr:SURF1 family protein [Cellulomonas marina]GIG30281.1 SURF1-like protein [Cellulomonas marina]SFB31241.1 Cytochrome oxidase assembly protein ShyY1 [Cellulomonas marina]